MEPNVTTTGTSTNDNRPLFGATNNLLPLPFANPFVGLRPFKTEESQLFFGRDEQIIELLSQLHRTRFLAVVGSSGCGKSSLIRAGLIPKLKAGFLVEDRDLWLTATMKPGDAPLRNLAAALLEAAGGGQESDQGSDQQIDALAKQFRQLGAEAVTTQLTPVLSDSSSNLLLLIDQFEEIFRFGVESNDAEKREEAEDFIALMLALAEQKQLPIYVVLTMRSDFLGDCDNFYGLPEAMNRSQYLVPRLTRQQRQQAIEGPIRLFNAQIAPRLLDRVLNDVGDKSDQLPVMQHALMRTWDEWKHLQHKHQPLPEVIGLCCYEAIGEMTDALSRHADEAFDELPDDRHRKVAEKMFKALAGKGKDNRVIRRPVVLNELCAITEASEKEVKRVIETFRQPGRSFLMPPIETQLGKDTLIDISHESLIRNWKGKTEMEADKRLKEWIEDEGDSAKQYLRLAEAAKRSIKGQAALWIDPDLQIALDWRDKHKPNEAWARRYDTDEQAFHQALDFLDRSERKINTAISKRKRSQIHQLNRTRATLVISIALLAVYIHLSSLSDRIQAGSLDENILYWVTRIVSSYLYWMLIDVLYLFLKIIEKWNSIRDPAIKLGGLLFSILVLLNLIQLSRRQRQANRLTIYCPVDQAPARPIPGSRNRYRCFNGHQFNGDSHGYE